LGVVFEFERKIDYTSNLVLSSTFRVHGKVKPQLKKRKKNTSYPVLVGFLELISISYIFFSSSNSFWTLTKHTIIQ